MVDALLNAPLQSQGLALAEDDDDNLPGLENSLHADRQSHFGHLCHVVAKEARVGQDGVVGERLDAGAAGKTGAGLVEGDVAILADASKEQVNAAGELNGVLVCNALGLEVDGVAVEDMDVGGVDVDMGEEVLPHEGVIGLGVIARDPDVLVHVEGHDMFKGDLP